MTWLLLLACTEKPDSAQPAPDTGPDDSGEAFDTAADTDTAADSDTATDSGEDTGVSPAPPEHVALLTGGPQELRHIHVSDTLLDGGPAVVLGSQVTYPDVERQPGDVVVATATTSVYRYPARGETRAAPDAEGDGASEPLYVGDVDEDGFDDLLVGTWVGVVSEPSGEGYTSVEGHPSLSLLLGPFAAGAPLPEPAWTVELGGSYSLVATRGPAPDGVGEATYVEDWSRIQRVEPATGALEPLVSRADWAETLVAADLDGDGLGDLARLDRNAAYVCLGPWVEEGPRSDADLHWYVSGLQPRDLAAGDFDEDGRAELAFATVDGVWLLPLEGGGDVDDSGAPRLDAQDRFNVTRLAVGDQDGDGDDDLLIGDIYVGDGGSAWLLRGPVSGSLDLDAVATPLVAETDDRLGAAVAFGPGGDVLVGTRYPGQAFVFGAP